MKCSGEMLEGKTEILGKGFKGFKIYRREDV